MEAAYTANDPQKTTNQRKAACHNIERLRHEDALQESLEKAIALLRIFGCTPVGDYDEDTLRWFFAIILDLVHTANDAWEALQNFR